MKIHLYSFWFLFLGLSSLKAQSAKHSGVVKSYHTSVRACFYVDPEMLELGIARPLGDKKSTSCQDAKYKTGALVDFSQMSSDRDYQTPPTENTLIEITGYWKKIESSYVFYVTSWEPFF